MSPKTIFFAGAPLPWDLPSDSAVLTSFPSSIRRFAGLESAGVADVVDHHGALPQSTSAPAPWHSLTLNGEHLATGYSQVRGWQEEYQGNAAYYAAEDPTFLGTAYTSQDDTCRSSGGQVSQLPAQQALEDVTYQFYEHSLALHDDLPTSQIAPVASGDAFVDVSKSNGTSFEGTTSFRSTLEQDSVLSTTTKKPIPSARQITNLDRLPNENYLKSISPQTMSINVICGIISISPPRSITTRHGSTVEIVEMLVGDDHKSGFAINFWLPSPKTKSALREALQDLRPQDIILVKNMALSSFKGKVYGQSLRKEMTKVDLLYRNRIDRTDRAGCYSIEDLSGSEDSQMHPQVLKTKKVKDWVLHFVGGAPKMVRTATRKGKGKGKRTAEVAGMGEMPPDTQ